MAGERRKAEYFTSIDGVKYKIFLKPLEVNSSEINLNTRKPNANRKRNYIIISLFVLTVISFATYTIYTTRTRPNIFPASIKKSISYPLYYPRKVPDGFTLKQGSVQQLENGTVVYILNYENSKELTVTQQTKPDNFDSSILTGSQSIETRLGSAYVGNYGNHPVGIILTEKTLIFLNDMTSTTDNKIKEIITGY